MAVNLGTAFGSVKIDASGVTAGMQEARGAFDSGLANIGPGIEKIGSQISGLGGTLAGMAAPALAGFGLATKSAADFDAAVTNVGAVLRMNRDDVDALKEKLLEIGGDSIQGPQAVAEAYYDIAGGVADTSTHMDILQTALDVSTGSSAKLGGVVNALTKTMNIYRFSAEQAGFAGDVLTQAVNKGMGTMDEYAAALPDVEAQANALGISFQDVGGYMAYMSTKSASVAQGGTQLSGVLSKLMNPSKELGDAIAAMGYTSGEAMVKQEGLTGALNKIKAFGGGSFAGLITDQEALTGALALTADGAQTFFDTYTTGIEGATSNALQTQMQSDANQMALFNSTVSELAINIGGTLAPVMTDLIQQIRPVIDGVIAWIKQNPELVKQIAMVVAVIGGLGAAMMVIGPVISGVGALLGLLFSPIGLIVAALAGLKLAFDNNFLGIRDLIQPILDQVGQGLGALVEGIQIFISDIQQFGLGEAIRMAFGLGGAGGESWIEGVLVAFGMAGDTANSLVSGIVSVFSSLATFVTTQVLPALSALANWFLNDVLPQVVGFVTTVVIPAVQSFVGYLASLWAIVQPGLAALADWFINSALPAIAGFITGTVLPAIQQFGLILLGLWETVKPYLLELADWFINTALPAVVAFINDTVIPGVQDFIDILASIWTLVQPVLQQLYDWFITTGIPFIQTAIQGVMDNFITPLINLIAGIWDNVGPFLGDLFNWFVTTGIPFIQTAIQGLMDNFITPMINLIAGIWEGVRTGIDNFKNGIESAFKWVSDNVIKPVSDAISGLLNTIATADLNPFDSNGIMLNPFAKGGLFNRDSGGMGEAGQPYLIGAGAQPELFVPSSAGRFYPNADKLMGGGDEGRGSVNISGVTIHANSAAEGRAAADGFEARLRELMAARGGA